MGVRHYTYCLLNDVEIWRESAVYMQRDVVCAAGNPAGYVIPLVRFFASLKLIVTQPDAMQVTYLETSLRNG